MTAEPEPVELQGTVAEAAGPRMFHLERDIDVSGVSGVGHVADGVLWPDGSVTIRWRGDQPSTVNWGSIAHAEAVHGHGGQTRIVFDDDLAAGDVPQSAPPPVKIGTGMPATTLLEAFGQWVYDAFGETAYHVGSSTKGKTWRDVDVRLMLDDDEFDALFPGYRAAHQRDAKWALICAAISELGTRLTGLPIDFQMQRATAANKLYGRPHKGHYRNPLWLYNHASVQAEKQRRAESDGQADLTPPEAGNGEPDPET